MIFHSPRSLTGSPFVRVCMCVCALYPYICYSAIDEIFGAIYFLAGFQALLQQLDFNFFSLFQGQCRLVLLKPFLDSHTLMAIHAMKYVFPYFHQ